MTNADLWGGPAQGVPVELRRAEYTVHRSALCEGGSELHERMKRSREKGTSNVMCVVDRMEKKGEEADCTTQAKI